MLFDLQSGKRRRLVQVVYSLLAASFLIGFVIFGVGTGGGIGGIGDLISGGSSGASTSAYDDKIDAANEKLAKDPKNEQALLQVAENEYLKGKVGVSQDQSTGQISLSSDAHAALGRSADAWETYLHVAKGKPDSTTATEMVNVYIYLDDASGAAQAGRIVAEQKPSVNSYGNLALFEYAANDIPAGDAARDKAVAEAPSSAAKKQISKQLAPYRKQAVKQKQQAAKAPKGATSTALQNPFGSFGTSAPPPSGG